MIWKAMLDAAMAQRSCTETAGQPPHGEGAAHAPPRIESRPATKFLEPEVLHHPRAK